MLAYAKMGVLRHASLLGNQYSTLLISFLINDHDEKYASWSSSIISLTSPSSLPPSPTIPSALSFKTRYRTVCKS